MKSDHLHEIKLDRLWIFQRGSLFHVIGRPKKGPAPEHEKLEWEIKIPSAFGEKFYVNMGSVDHFLLDPKTWFMDYYRLEVPDNEVLDEIAVAVLKLARSEIQAEYLFLHDKMDEFLDLLANDPIARKHILSIKKKKTYEDQRDKAQRIAYSIDARVAWDKAVKDSLPAP